MTEEQYKLLVRVAHQVVQLVGSSSSPFPYPFHIETALKIVEDEHRKDKVNAQ
jgi:hypothetical protein